MKHTILSLLLAVILSPLCQGCGDDIPEAIPTDLLAGIWMQDNGNYLQILDKDHMYQYILAEDQSEFFWLKYRQTYLYEPYSELVLRENPEGGLDVYKLTQYNPSQMTMCWVASPLIENLDGDNKYDFLKIFFDQDYVVDPANDIVYTSVPQKDFDAVISRYEVIEP